MAINQKITLTEALDKVSDSVLDQQKIMCFATAIHMASNIPLPSSQVEDPHMYLLGNHRMQMNEQVSKLNEIFVFDFKCTLELVDKLWSMRYRLAFNPVGLELVRPLISVGDYLSVEDTAYINDNQDSIQWISSVICDLLCEK